MDSLRDFLWVFFFKYLKILSGKRYFNTNCVGGHIRLLVGKAWKGCLKIVFHYLL